MPWVDQERRRKYQAKWTSEHRQHLRDYHREYNNSHPENKAKNRTRGRIYHRQNAPWINEKKRVRDDGFRFQALSHYSPQLCCAWCFYSNIQALCIDHIANNGAEHRKAMKGDKIYRWLNRNGYPSGFQVLCLNCNWIKEIESRRSSTMGARHKIDIQ